MEKPISRNEWVLKCLIAENLDRNKAYEHARRTPFWAAFEGQIVVKGWNAIIDEAKRAMKVKLNAGGDGLHQLEFDIMYALEDGSLKETRRLTLYEFRYLIEVRRKQNSDDVARLRDFQRVDRLLAPWWDCHPGSSFEEAVLASGIDYNQDDSEEGDAAA